MNVPSSELYIASTAHRHAHRDAWAREQGAPGRATFGMAENGGQRHVRITGMFQSTLTNDPLGTPMLGGNL